MCTAVIVPCTKITTKCLSLTRNLRGPNDVEGVMWSNYIMNLLMLLQAFGTSPSPGSQAAAFDFNGNGVIDSADLMEMLAQQPPLCTQPKSWPTPSR